MGWGRGLLSLLLLTDIYPHSLPRSLCGRRPPCPTHSYLPSSLLFALTLVFPLSLSLPLPPPPPLRLCRQIYAVQANASMRDEAIERLRREVGDR